MYFTIFNTFRYHSLKHILNWRFIKQFRLHLCGIVVLKKLKHFVNDLKTTLFVIEWSAQKRPRLPELQEMDDKQCWKSLKVLHRSSK